MELPVEWNDSIIFTNL